MPPSDDLTDAPSERTEEQLHQLRRDLHDRINVVTATLAEEIGTDQQLIDAWAFVLLEHVALLAASANGVRLDADDPHSIGEWALGVFNDLNAMMEDTADVE